MSTRHVIASRFVFSHESSEGMLVELLFTLKENFCRYKISYVIELIKHFQI